MTRVRDVLMPRYVECGPGGMFALAMMRKALDDAAKAMISGDVVEMLRCCQELKDFTE